MEANLCVHRSKFWFCPIELLEVTLNMWSLNEQTCIIGNGLQGGEDDEKPIEAARREVFEQAGLIESCMIMPLDSINSIPVEHVVGEFFWGEDVLVIKEFSFGIEVSEKELLLSREHAAYKWVSYEEAMNELKWAAIVQHYGNYIKD
jgi:8-oxo-dGTP pyrophosphatase MutT (NUDIX family)